MEAFTFSDVPICTGVSRPTLQKWIDRGWVRASARTDAGPEGSPLFTRVDLYHILNFSRLAKRIDHLIAQASGV